MPPELDESVEEELLGDELDELASVEDDDDVPPPTPAWAGSSSVEYAGEKKSVPRTAPHGTTRDGSAMPISASRSSSSTKPASTVASAEAA